MKYNKNTGKQTLNSTKRAGLGYLDILEIIGLIFIILKLCGIIHWSWIWVLMPTFLPIILVIVVCLGLILKCCISHLFKKIKNK